MRGSLGTVDDKGNSALGGLDVYDMVELAENYALDAETERKLEELFSASGVAIVKARYKLELMFDATARSREKPYMGVIYAVTNGGHFHGGGDGAVYFCPARKEDGKQCAAPIDLEWISRKMVLCPTCRQSSKPEDLVGQVLARLPTQHWATLTLKLFEKLGGDADLCMILTPGNMREAAKKEQQKEHRGDLLYPIYGKRRRVTYSLKNIVKDTSAGADLYLRIKSFLAA